MENNFLTRVKNAWNVFRNKDPTQYSNIGTGYMFRPDRPRFSRGNERSIINSVYNRIALDVAAMEIRHVRLDKNDRYMADMDSGLNNCLTLEANIDQTGRAFIQDIVMSMLDEGVVAIVPTNTTLAVSTGNVASIDTMRTGRIVDWYPNHVKINLYNDLTGNKEDIILPKMSVAIVENPFYSVMNEPNSTLQRLLRKLTLLDSVDESTSSGKLDLIVQLPYVIKTEARKKQAEIRRKELEDQLAGSKYGVAYTDGTEHITQLNRSVENNLMNQIQYLTELLYSQLGITQSILDETADEKTMLNYNNRTIKPILMAITDEMKRKFLSKTARTQGQSISYFTDPFGLVPVSSVAEIADKFTRNEIMTSNEIRQAIGMKPADDPKADQLINSNISQPADKTDTSTSALPGNNSDVKETIQNE